MDRCGTQDLQYNAYLFTIYTVKRVTFESNWLFLMKKNMQASFEVEHHKKIFLKLINFEKCFTFVKSNTHFHRCIKLIFTDRSNVSKAIEKSLRNREDSII